VADDGDDVRVLDGVVTTPVLVSKPCTAKGCDVRPELVEHRQARGSTLTHVQGTGARLLKKAGTGLGTRGKRLLDEV
jgi:hypothetical protein